MELRRIGEALLRARPSTVLSRPCQNRTAMLASRDAVTSIPRAFSVSAMRRQQQSAPSPSTEAESRENPSSGDANSKQSLQQGASHSMAEDIGSLLNDSLGFSRNGPTGRTSRFSSPSAQNLARNTTSYGFPSGSSADEATARFNRSNSVSDNMERLFKGDDSRFNYSLGDLGSLGISSSTPQKSLVEPPDPSTLPRLGPTVGRSVPIRDNMDLAKGLRQLDMICARNKVRRDFQKQRFHERPGLKRKRLASERWRKRFMEGFKATVSRVQYLKRQGW